MSEGKERQQVRWFIGAWMRGRDRVTLEDDGHHLREVAEPQLYPTDHGSPQPFLPVFDTLAWNPARRLVPYRPRRRSASTEKQGTLFEPEHERSIG